MYVHPHACVCIVSKRQKANSLGNITWSELGKQNIQGKKCIRILRSVLSKMGYSVVNYHVLNAKNIREIRKIDKQRYLNSPRDLNSWSVWNTNVMCPFYLQITNKNHPLQEFILSGL